MEINYSLGNKKIDKIYEINNKCAKKIYNLKNIYL